MCQETVNSVLMVPNSGQGLLAWVKGQSSLPGVGGQSLAAGPHTQPEEEQEESERPGLGGAGHRGGTDSQVGRLTHM